MKSGGASIVEKALAAIERTSSVGVCLYHMSSVTAPSPLTRVPERRCYHCHPWCLLVKSTRRGQEACVHSDGEAVAAAMRDRTPRWHTCHAGMHEYILPFFAGDYYLGSILLGQVFPRPLPEAAAERLVARLSRLGIRDKAKIRTTLGTVPVVPPAALRDALPLAELFGALLRTTWERHQERETVIRTARRGTTAGSAALPPDTLHRSTLDHLRQQGNIRRTVRQLDDIPLEQLSLQVAAAKAGLSIFHFSRQFRRHTGRTFRTYLNERRIETARRLLREPGNRMDEIAGRCGYRSFSSFARHFKRMTGMAPGAFRSLDLISDDGKPAPPIR